MCFSIFTIRIDRIDITATDSNVDILSKSFANGNASSKPTFLEETKTASNRTELKETISFGKSFNTFFKFILGKILNLGLRGLKYLPILHQTVDALISNKSPPIKL